MKKTKKAIALMLAGTVMAGCFVGCDLVTKDSNKDLAQVIATVDITRSEEFAEGGMYAEYKDVIGEVEISKRDMIAYYQDVGYSYQQNYNLSYKEAFDWVCQSLVIRQLDVQYTMAYLLKEKVEDSEGNAFTVEGYKAAVAAEEDSGINLREIKCDGGASANNFLMQFQSNLLGVGINRPSERESTALGAALMCAVSLGEIPLQEIPRLRRSERIFSPQGDREQYNKLYREYRRAVERTLL